VKFIIVAIISAAVVAAGPMDQKGVEYGRPGGHPLLLDLHVPDGPGPFPAAILVHGGGFDGGSRATNMAPRSSRSPTPDSPGLVERRRPAALQGWNGLVVEENARPEVAVRRS
jgi:hypothetical protein